MMGCFSGLLVSTPAWASFSFVNSFSTFPSAVAPDGRPVAGTADFYYDNTANQLMIVLTNTETGASGDGCTGVCGISQLLTGANFTAVGLTITNGASAQSAAITKYDATHNSWDSSTNPPTKTTTLDSDAASAWKVTSLGSNQYQFDSSPLFAQPIANTTIKYNDGLKNGHTHEINQTAFVLSVTGTLSQISSVSLNFGTGSDLHATTATTPEPGFYGLLSLGMAGMLFVRRRKKAF